MHYAAFGRREGLSATSIIRKFYSDDVCPSSFVRDKLSNIHCNKIKKPNCPQVKWLITRFAPTHIFFQFS